MDVLLTEHRVDFAVLVVSIRPDEGTKVIILDLVLIPGHNLISTNIRRVESMYTAA